MTGPAHQPDDDELVERARELAPWPTPETLPDAETAILSDQRPPKIRKPRPRAEPET